MMNGHGVIYQTLIKRTTNLLLGNKRIHIEIVSTNSMMQMRKYIKCK